MLALKPRKRRFHGRTGSHAVIRDDDDFSGNVQNSSISELLDVLGNFLVYRSGSRTKIGISDVQTADQLLIKNWFSVLRNCADCQFQILRGSDLFRYQDLKRCVK